MQGSTVWGKLSLLRRHDPARHPSPPHLQIVLVVNQIFWTQEVEEAFSKLRSGRKSALKEYNDFQIQQLTKVRRWWCWQCRRC